jgi:hypothetical protein
MITVTLGYFEDCPNWQVGRARLQEAVWRVGRDLFVVECHLVASHEQAVAAGFGGSPSFHIRGRDLFAGPVAPLGLTCRLYQTPDGQAGAPTVEQLIHVLEWALIE